MKTNTFQIGQQVQFKGRRHSGTGVVTEIHRVFAQVDNQGRFVRGGLQTQERDIRSICLPFTFDGETLKVEYPEQDYKTWVVQKAYTHTSRFFGFDYTVQDTRGNLLILAERQLRHTDIKDSNPQPE